MMEIEYIVNGRVVNPPSNHEEASVELRFDTDATDFRGQVTTNSWIFDGGDSNDPKDAVNIINEYVNGDISIGQNIRFDILIKELNSVQTLLEGSLDLMSAQYSCGQIVADSLERGGIDWFNTRADSFTFRNLHEELASTQAGYISEDDFLDIPYTLLDKPEEAFTAILSAFVLTRELIQSFKEFQEFSIAFTADYLEFGNLVTLVFILLQNILLLLALIILTKQILELIIKPVKYTSGMYVRTLCEKAAEYMGLDFQSSILYGNDFYNLVIIPESYQQYVEPIGNWGNVLKNTIGARIGVFDARNNDKNGFYNGTFGDLLRNLKTMFNAKLIIQDGKLFFERNDFFLSTDLYQIPDLDLSTTLSRINKEDYNTYFKLSFIPDINDKNVWQNFIGTQLEAITTLRTINLVEGTINGGNSVEKTVEFALGRSKKQMSWIDKFFITFFTNAVAKLTNKIKRKINRQIRIANQTNPVARLIKKLNAIGLKLEYPKGTQIPPLVYPNFAVGFTTTVLNKLRYLMMEEDYINTPKIMLFNQGIKPNNADLMRVANNNDDLINAEYLYNEFYDSEGFAIKAGNKHNQYKIYDLNNVPFCLEDYNKVKNNSLILTSDGITKANIVSLTWNIHEQKADITYKVNTLISDNFVEKTMVSDGR